MKLKFNSNYFIAFLILFGIETLIALFLKSGFIRNTFGDFLVVILIYCFFKSFIKGHSFQIALGVFVLSYIIEFAQLFNLLEFLNLHDNSIAKIVLGSTFHISDLLAYTLGTISILIFEHLSHGNN